MKRMLLPMVLGVLWISTRPAVAEPSASELTDRMARAAGELKTYSADVSVSANGRGVVVNSKGHTEGKNAQVDGKTVRKLRTTMKIDVTLADGRRASTERLLVNDGTHAWIESQGPGGTVRVLKYPASKLAGASGAQSDSDPAEAVQNIKQIYDLRVTGKDTEDGTPVYVLEGRLSEDYLKQHPDKEKALRAMNSRIKLYVGTQDYFVRKSVSYDDQGRQTIVRQYTNIHLNEPLDDSRFNYTPPKDAEVKEVTK